MILISKKDGWLNLLDEQTGLVGWSSEENFSGNKPTTIFKGKDYDESFKIFKERVLEMSKSIKEAISILKFLIKEQISKDDEDLLIQFGIAHKKNDVLELSSQGKNLKSELNLNIGTLKRIKNLSSDNEQLMNMLDQIKG